MTAPPQSIRKILVANRGEIASRVFRTCRQLGIECVAIFSDADASMPFVREADEALRIGPPPAKDSYLNGAAIIQAAQRSGADAIHPGYGFLAENPAFAEAVREAGLNFIGPSSSTMRAVGAKREAKAAMKAAGVPVVPGYDGADQSALETEAKRVGFPLLIKASAGGGGKGMKRVDAESDVGEAIKSARRESEKAFGDGTLILERYIEGGRHIEVQIAGDASGDVMHLHERDCSVQRRHQKVVEECPAPGLGDELRARIHDAALKVAQAVDYTNVGTVEFIVQGDEFYFLEVNARLQVEHAVTEEVLGVDLVEWQIHLAEGKSLPPLGAPNGAAVEVRVYAEGADYLPQTGRVLDWHVPAAPGLRIENGVEAGSEVGVHYDPMLAKIVAYGATRERAIARLRNALRRSSMLGVTTNRDLLLGVLGHPAFVAGELSTHFLRDHELGGGNAFAPEAIAVAALWEMRRLAGGRRHLPNVGLGFTNNARMSAVERWTTTSGEAHVSWRTNRDGSVVFVIDETEYDARFIDDGTVEVAGRRFDVRVKWHGDDAFVSLLGECHHLVREPRFALPGAGASTGTILAPMPGTIVAVHVAEGDSVGAGTPLLVMEAMKMEHVLVAAEEGVVREIRAKTGDAVEAGAMLVQVE